MGNRKGKDWISVIAYPRRETNDTGAAVTPCSPQRPRPLWLDIFYRHAVHRCASMVGSLGANAAASVGLVSTSQLGCSGVQPLRWDFPAVAASYRSRGFRGSQKILRQAVTATLFSFAVGCWRYLYHRYASSLVGWRRGDMERFVLYIRIFCTIPACLAVDSGHVALQWE